MKLTGIWCFGDYITRPITFEKTNIIINWSYYELKLEFIGSYEDVDIILPFYENMWKYGEWGEFDPKKIIWMSVETRNKYTKSKSFFEIENIKDFIKKNDFKITIFFENVIDGDPLSNGYINSNDYWIDCIGGLYNVADISLYVEDNENIYPAEKYMKKHKTFKIEDYTKENLYEYAKETAKSAKNLINNSKKWKIFKKIK